VTVIEQDRLTIWKLLWLTAGVGIGLSCFNGPFDQYDWMKVESWRFLFNGILSGLSLPAIAFGFSLRLRGRRLGPGALFGMMSGLGALLMLPPAALGASAGLLDSGNVPLTCMYFIMPLMALWFLLAAIVGGALRPKIWSSTTPWTERYGYLLAVGWTPLGIWVMFDIYRDAFK